MRRLLFGIGPSAPIGMRVARRAKAPVAKRKPDGYSLTMARLLAHTERIQFVAFQVAKITGIKSFTTWAGRAFIGCT